MTTEWMNAEQAANYVGCSRRLIYRAANKGELRVARIGSRGDIRTCAEWINDYMEANAPPPVHDNAQGAGTSWAWGSRRGYEARRDNGQDNTHKQ